MFTKIVIRNIGVLRAFEAGSSPPLSQLSLFYARNGRGKSTLTSVLRAARDGNASTVLARRSLGNNAAAPHVTLISDVGNHLFKDGEWQEHRVPIEVFDAEFIADNVFAGEMTELVHDRGLFSIIIGEEGVRLARLLDRFKDHAKKTGATLKSTEDALADDKPTDLSREEFFALGANPEYAQRLDSANKSLRAVQEASKLSELKALENIEPPVFPADVEGILAATLPDINMTARNKLAGHFKHFQLGKNGEAWLGFGVDHMRDGECPFCARPNADELGMVTLYGQIFGEEYKSHLGNISTALEGVDGSLDEDKRATVVEVLQRNLKASKEWAKYGQFVSELPVCLTLGADLKEAYGAMKSLLKKKRSSPLEPVDDAEQLQKAKTAIMRVDASLSKYNLAVNAFNEETKSIQSRSYDSEEDAQLAVANIKRRIARVEDTGVQRRIEEYLAASRRDRRAKNARQVTQQRLKQANEDAAGHYHQRVNFYLERFGVSARITRPKSSMAGNAGAADYSLLIRGEEIARQRGRIADAVPHFRNTLSSGDKMTLALAFFLAKLDHDGELQKKVIVFDDPLASHDSHRRGRTVEAVKELTGRCIQLILLSHDEYFLRDVEKRCVGIQTATYQMEYTGSDEWSEAKHVQLIELCKSDHAKRLDKLIGYADARVGDPDNIILHVRQVLETHFRRSFSAYFSRKQNLGQIVKDIDAYSGVHPCADVRDRLDQLNFATCDTHHGDDAVAMPKKGIDPDALKIIVTDALSLIGAKKPSS